MTGERGPEERRTSAQGVAANAAVLALARAARAFTLYDPANKVVRTLIADYREKSEKVLAAHGPLVLRVLPFEMLLDSEVVYVEKDRERSLAFRLFRDGVRQLTLTPGIGWDELLRLLEVLSIRYTGVRQQEDDLVTALRKADFAHITVGAIEGFVPEEEQAEAAADTVLRGNQTRYDPPPGFDLPLPAFEGGVPLRYRILPPELLEQLRAEESAASLPQAAVRAVAELLQALGGRDRDAVFAFGLEVRDYLQVERRLDLQIELGRGAARALAASPEVARAFLEAYLDPSSLAGLVEALPADQPPPAALLDLLDAAPAAVAETLLQLLAKQVGSPRADALALLAARPLQRDPEALAARLRSARGAEAAALLRLLAGIDPASAPRRALEAAQKPEAALQREALRQLCLLPPAAEAQRVAQQLLQSPAEEVRAAAAELLGKAGPRAFPALQAHAEKAAASLGAAEAEALGRALSECAARQAVALFDTWLKARSGGLLGRASRMAASPSLQRAALSGLRGLPGPQASALLGLLASSGEAAVADEARAALDARPVGGAARG